MIKFWTELFENLPDWGPQMLRAAGETLQLTAASFILAMLIGSFVALVRRSDMAPLRWAAILYIEVGRGTPALVILFLIYFGLPAVSPNLQFDSFTAAAIGLGLQGGAVMAEVFRAGIEAVDTGQREAALSLGLPPVDVLRFVVLPQALRIMLPPLCNYAVQLLKDTTLASSVAAPEIMFRARNLVMETYLSMQVYLLVACIYLCFSIPMSHLASRLEARARGGQR